MKKYQSLVVLILFFNSCFSGRIDLEKIKQEIKSGEIINDKFIISSSYPECARELKVIIARGCDKRSNLKLTILDKILNTPMAKAAVFLVEEYGEKEFLLKSLGAADNNGEICISKENLKNNGVLIGYVGYFKLLVRI